jgi:hypothetical protein
MASKPDMTLVVNVTVEGSVDVNGVPSISAQYTEGASSPSSPNVVDSSGDLDLQYMAYDPNQYDVDTDITFNLSGQILDLNRNPVSFNFPSDPSQAVTILLNGQPAVNLRARSGINPMQVIIDDEDNDAQTYTYCLGIYVASPAPDGTIVQLDPSIVNRPV